MPLKRAYMSDEDAKRNERARIIGLANRKREREDREAGEKYRKEAVGPTKAGARERELKAAQARQAARARPPNAKDKRFSDYIKMQRGGNPPY